MPIHTAADSAHRGAGIAYKLYRGHKICEFQADKAEAFTQHLRRPAASVAVAQALNHVNIATAGV
jgi:hypothetical protein